MKRVALASFVIASVLGLAGCSTITASFKAGAGPGNTADDEKECRASGASESAFLECMRAKGYFMSGPSTAPTAEAVAAPTAVVAPLAVATPAAKAVTAAAVASMTPTPEVAAPAPAAPAAYVAPAAPPPGSESLPRVHVRSWWKLGGTASGLDAAIAKCTKILGPPHQPTAGALVTTVAMRDCLRGEGWYAYDESPVE